MARKPTPAENRQMRRGHVTRLEDWADPDLCRDEVSRLNDREVEIKGRLARHADEIVTLRKILEDGPARLAALAKMVHDDEGKLESLKDRRLRARQYLMGAQLIRKQEAAERKVAELKRELVRLQAGLPATRNEGAVPAGECEKDPSHHDHYVDRGRTFRSDEPKPPVK